ncbi:serine and arginine rich splicing factor 5b isoform X1 [Pundamilia nyererei]|uniref:Serine/arginine-rich splicing factor 5 n=1 Tax=Pundamilia nyererei TaxID=303518 RepID=A0A9Y6JC73_9CICH|nr:PREDICTED: serine/arginine-rich splicing factor 5-like isoform X1 [Pundamilia nyererei]
MSGCRIFIGRLSPSAREKDVERFFKGYGRIRDIDLKRGFGFVEFDDPRDAEDAVYELDGKELCNERVTIEHARVRLRGGRGRGGGGGGGRFSDRYGRGSQNSRSRNPPPMRTENRLIVENLSSRVSWQDLKDFMRQAGEVTFADAHRPKLNEGVVEFASHSDLKNALDKLSGKEINGRKIKLIEAAKKRCVCGKPFTSNNARIYERCLFLWLMNSLFPCFSFISFLFKVCFKLNSPSCNKSVLLSRNCICFYEEKQLMLKVKHV